MGSEVFTLNNTGKYLLIELPTHELPPHTLTTLFSLSIHGITPIVAHPERNQEIINKPEILFEFVEKGFLIQVNASSITGRLGKKIQSITKIFLTHNWVHLLGSDAHKRNNRIDDFKTAIQIMERWVGRKNTENVINNAQKIWHGEPLVVQKPIPYRLIKFFGFKIL